MQDLKKVLADLWLRFKVGLSIFLNKFSSYRHVKSIIETMEDNSFQSVWIKTNYPKDLQDKFYDQLENRFGELHLDIYSYNNQHVITHNSRTYVFATFAPPKDVYHLYDYVFHWNE